MVQFDDWYSPRAILNFLDEVWKAELSVPDSQRELMPLILDWTRTFSNPDTQNYLQEMIFLNNIDLNPKLVTLFLVDLGFLNYHPEEKNHHSKLFLPSLSSSGQKSPAEIKASNK